MNGGSVSMIVNKALITAAVLLFTAPVVPALAHDDYGGQIRCLGIGVCPGNCMITTGGVITPGGVITTGGVATTVAGGTVAGGTMGGDTNPRVLTFARVYQRRLCL